MEGAHAAGRELPVRRVRRAVPPGGHVRPAHGLPPGLPVQLQALVPQQDGPGEARAQLALAPQPAPLPAHRAREQVLAVTTELNKTTILKKKKITSKSFRNVPTRLYNDCV